MENPRIDKYLWAIRVYKTRSEATDACRGSKVSINGQVVKASRDVKINDVIVVRKGPIHYSYQVLALLDHRVSAVRARLIAPLLQTTPPNVGARLIAPMESGQRPRGTGRPTKKERRELDRVMGNP